MGGYKNKRAKLTKFKFISNTRNLIRKLNQAGIKLKKLKRDKQNKVVYESKYGKCQVIAIIQHKPNSVDVFRGYVPNSSKRIFLCVSRGGEPEFSISLK